MVPEKPLAGVSVTVAVFPVPGVTCTVTLAGVPVKLVPPVTVNVGVPLASVAAIWKLTGVFCGGRLIGDGAEKQGVRFGRSRSGRRDRDAKALLRRSSNRCRWPSR